MRVAQLSGGAVGYLEAGQGEPIVLLHGIGSSARSWSAVLDILSARWRGLAWSAPGYPPSQPLQPDAPSPGDYAARLAEWLDACGVHACHLVGHSLGCLIAARFARDNPARVRTLTLASCALGHAQLDAQERQRLLSARIADVRDLGPRAMAEKRAPRLLGPHAARETIDAVTETMAGVDPGGYAQAARMLSSGDLIGDIGTFPASIAVQFVHGTADVITPPEANLRAAAARPQAPVSALEGAGHACYIEQPRAFARIIEEFARVHG